MLFPGAVASQERWFTYLCPMSAAVQMEGATVEILVLREMHNDPVEGKYSPLVVSLEGV